MRNDSHKSRFVIGPLTAVLLMGAVAASGCTTDPPATSYMSPLAVSEDFEAGQNRPPSPDTLYRMARLLSAQGKDLEALATLNATLRDHPDFVPAYNEMAAINMRADRHADAEAILEHGLSIVGDDAVLLNNLGMCRMMQDDFAGAQSAFQRASAAAPASERYRANLALATGMLGDYDEAYGLYEQFMDPTESHHNVAVIAEARNDPERAAYERAMASGYYEEPQAAAEAEQTQAQP